MTGELVITEVCQRRFDIAMKAIQQLLDTDVGHQPLLIAIDGGAASGKTTLGNYLQEKFACNLFHMDDFFLQNNQRTAERMQEIGGNVDYERFFDEVIQPLQKGKDVQYRPYSCATKCINAEVTIPYKRLNIIEGSYSQHPHFGDCYQLRFFTEITLELQAERILKRNGEIMLQRFRNEWIPKEQAYFDKFAIREKSIVIP